MYAGQPRGFRFIRLTPSRLRLRWPLTAIRDDEQCWPQASNDAISAACLLREPARGSDPFATFARNASTLGSPQYAAAMEAIMSRGQVPGGKATGRDISRKSPARC